MATMGFVPLDGNGVRLVYLPSVAGATNFDAGDAVYLNSGVVTRVADGTTANGVFGVAAADSQAASFSCPVYVADPHSVWVGTVDGASVEGTVGNNYGLIVTSGSMAVGQSLTTNTLVRIIDVHPADGYKALGRVLFCWKSSAIQGNAAAD